MAENTYESIRKQRILENIKQLENLGISQISKCLLDVAKCESQLLKRASPRSKKKFEVTEVRRSSRARNLVISYQDQENDIDLRLPRKRHCRNEREYTRRIASYEEQVCAVRKAEGIQSGLDPSNPSFVKSMVRSHVSSCFWLGLPSRFCKEFLPPNEFKMVLEDEQGSECDAVYIGARTGLSGGWRGFAMEHNLEDGDALVFELSEPNRFKIHIVKALGSLEDTEITSNDHKETPNSPEEDDTIVKNLPPSQKSKSRSRKQAAKQ